MKFNREQMQVKQLKGYRQTTLKAFSKDGSASAGTGKKKADCLVAAGRSSLSIRNRQRKAH